MVKFTNTLLVAALIAAPAFAISRQPGLTSRDIENAEVLSRTLESQYASVYGREFEGINGLSARELQELSERSPIFGHIINGIKNVAGRIFGRDIGDLTDLTEREVEELSERSPIFGHIFNGIKNVAGRIFGSRDLDDMSDLAEREVEALSARARSSNAGNSQGGLSYRDFEDEELVSRDPFFFLPFLAKKVLGKRDLSTRDFEDDELVSRDPFFFLPFLAKKVLGKRDLSGRDFEDDELVGRDPLFFLPFLASKVAGKVLGKREVTEAEQQIYTRALVDMMIDELD